LPNRWWRIAKSATSQPDLAIRLERLQPNGSRRIARSAAEQPDRQIRLERV